MTLDRVLDRLAGEDSRVAIDWQAGLRVPPRLEPLTQSVLAEALRNIGKHADPSRIAVAVGETGDALTLEVVNDGAGDPHPGAGLGLRLAAIEALRHEGVLEFGRIDEERWRVRLVCPLTGGDENGA